MELIEGVEIITDCYGGSSLMIERNQGDTEKYRKEQKMAADIPVSNLSEKRKRSKHKSLVKEWLPVLH